MGAYSYAREGPAQLWERPSSPTHPALTLRTVSLGVDHGSSGSEHGTAGPRDRSSHLLGKKVGGGERDSISPGSGRLGSTPRPILREDWEIPALGPGHLDPKRPS